MTTLRKLLPAIVFVPVALGACTSEPTTTPPANPPATPWGRPITGGTMTISHDGTRAVVSDPDRDRVVFLNLTTQKSTVTTLYQNDEPGRVVEDNAGRFHVALRRGGALVDLDASGNILGRRQVCAEPRGIGYDSTADVLHVACTSGDLVSFPAAGGTPIRHLVLDRDLRDVIVTPTGLDVTRFRTAEVLQLDVNGNVVGNTVPPDVQRFDANGNPIPGIPAIAWRTILLPDGRIVMSHQRQVNTPLHTQPGGYGGMCNNGPVEAAVSVIDPTTGFRTAPQINPNALPVDLAASPDNNNLAVLSAGAQTVQVTPMSAIEGSDMPPCGFGGGGVSPPGGSGGSGGPIGGGSGSAVPDIEGTPITGNPGVGTVLDDELGAPTSVAWDNNDNLYIYYPEYPAVVMHAGQGVGPGVVIALPGDLGYDSGREMFHGQTQIALACASCHPEGRDDGLIWLFADLGPRRTQNIGGHIEERAPYHWGGDMPDLPTLMNDVFTGRMEGPAVTHSELVSLGPWMETIQPPAAVPVVDSAAVARGQALFQSPATACTTCHNGELMTNKALLNVGTGGIFKVPSLIGVGARPPYLHDGCAPTLADRFGSCGGGDTHGHTSQLDAQNISDLVAYLETL